MTFAYPYALLLLPVLGLLFWYARRQSAEPALPFGDLQALREVTPSLRERLLWIPSACWWLGLVLLVIALAQPQTETLQTREEAEGIAIALVLDVSSSMDIRLDFRGERATRFSVAKEVLETFILGDGENLHGRPNDLLGLFTFARYADTISPMTHAHKALAERVREMELGTRPNEDGTAFGDATALAAARLKTMEETHTDGVLPEIASKVIILLSDGENNSGRILPLQAAALAKEWGIRIYTIMLGEGSLGLARNLQIDRLPEPNQAELVLEEMATMTGGIFRNAYDFDSLKSIYKEIDALETSQVSLVTFSEYVKRFAWFVIPALLLLAASRLLAHSLLRTVP